VLGVDGSSGAGTEGLRTGARTGVITRRISGFSKAMTASSLTRTSSGLHFPTLTTSVPRRGEESSANGPDPGPGSCTARPRTPRPRRGRYGPPERPRTGDPTDGRCVMSGTSYAVLAVVVVGGLVVLAALLGMFVTVGQNTVAVITMLASTAASCSPA
jgi:hypothetical protein